MAAGPAQQRRGTVLIRWILLIPHYVVLYFLGIGFSVVQFIGWWGALFTGRLPEFAVSFLSGYMRWTTRVQAYGLLLTDQYPPFSLEDEPGYPVRIELPPPGKLNRLAVLFRVILAIPASLLNSLVAFGAATIVAVIAWVITLITGKLPTPLHQAYTAVLRYTTRVSCYLCLLTAAYPAGLFGDGLAEPAAAAVPAADDLDEVASSDEAPADEVAPGDEAPVAAVASGDEAPVAAVASGDEAPADEVAPGDEAPVAAVASGDEAPVGAAAPGEEALVDVTPPVDEAPTDAEASADAAAPGDEVPVDAAAPGDEVPVDAAAPGDEVPADAAAPVDDTVVDGFAPVDETLVDAFAPIEEAAPADEAPADAEASVDAVTPVDESPIDLAAGQPADWRLLLTRGARQLLGWFIGIGAVIWVAYVLVIALVVAHQGHALSPREAIAKVNAANATLASSLNSYATTVQACTDAGCAERADTQAATDFTTFASTIHGLSMPGSAVADANTVYSDATKVAHDLTEISHLSPTISAAQYASDATTIGIAKDSNQFQSDSDALDALLNHLH